MLRKMTILTKFYLVILSVVLLLSGVLMGITFTEVRAGIERFASEKAESDIALASSYIDERFEGPWQIVDNELYKGDTRMNENEELMDTIGDMTNGLITIFQGRQPITTNLIIGGERAVSVEATGEVTEVVLEDGMPYSGQADILGDELSTAYLPITAPDGEILGMLFTATSQEAVNTIISDIVTKVVVAVVIVIAVIATLLVLFTRKIKQRINTLIKQLKLAGAGDLRETEADPYQDEIGEISASFSMTKSQLRELFHEVSHASKQLADSSVHLTMTSEQSAKASEEVANTVEDISKGAIDQAHDTEQGTEQMQELGGLVEQEQRFVALVNEATAEIGKLKDQGLGLVQELVSKTADTDRMSRDVHAMISETSENTERIEKASGMIRAISEQTNLLALNASIEAARAGEAGKGFAVVADEIRKLAEQSNTFSEEITTIIGALSAKTSEAVKTMEQSNQVSAEQSESVAKTTDTFRDVATSIERMRESVGSLSDSGAELLRKKESILSIMENLSAISEENAASTEQMSAAIEEQTASIAEVAESSESLGELAQKLERNVGRFQY
ncbi:methyl-accepting chemotaxis protein [Paenalkalicoccus suaedae]|uniref:Methyl-accepting chemotaxis protein n=1 Tax=Paenalkalicoccus suaedae TaxID=2592382 RepID=A0A859FHY5_9BACI|nr:methyl-accepting chemotaxis protein [Paenalkalicoccus suaedae]QKS72420.1 methyl-accepting chemotaxis protein [Paenalkalicoccus suaedae]